MKKRKQTNYFNDMNSFAIGTAKLGVTTGVAGAIGATSPIPVTGGLSTMASFTPIMGTMVGAGSVLKMVKKKKKGGY